MKHLTSRILEYWRIVKPQREAAKDKLSRKFSIEFNYNSNHIEGNTLTYGQTEVLLLFGKITGQADMFDLEEMKAHNIGLKMTLDEAKSETPLTETFIRQLHKTLLREDYIVYRNLPGGATSSYTIHAGRYKTRPNSVITVSGELFEYASPEETPGLMTDLIEWYRKEEERGVLNPLELASLFHYKYIRIHPFEDGNGRIARLMMNYILARHDYPMIVVPSKSKQEYLSALSKTDINVGNLPSDGAHATIEQITPFVSYLEKLMVIEMQTDIVIAEGNGNQWWFNGGWVVFENATVLKIIRKMTENPHVTVRQLSEIIGINTSAIQKHIKKLKERGYIAREGTATKGIWRVFLTRL